MTRLNRENFTLIRREAVERQVTARRAASIARAATQAATEEARRIDQAKENEIRIAAQKERALESMVVTLFEEFAESAVPRALDRMNDAVVYFERTINGHEITKQLIERVAQRFINSGCLVQISYEDNWMVFNWSSSSKKTEYTHSDRHVNQLRWLCSQHGAHFLDVLADTIRKSAINGRKNIRLKVKPLSADALAPTWCQGLRIFKGRKRLLDAPITWTAMISILKTAKFDWTITESTESRILNIRWDY